MKKDQLYKYSTGLTMYPWPNFSKIHRDRTTEIRYTSDQFIELYDVDEADLYMIMCKLKSGKRLDVFENDRYGKYILATIYKVMYNRPCYWKKSIERKQEIAEYAVLYALETAVKNFNPNYPAKTCGFLWRVALCGCALSCRSKLRAKTKEEKRQAHLQRCLEEYYAEVSDGKVRQQYEE
jgi:hypothetical protein